MSQSITAVSQRSPQAKPAESSADTPRPVPPEEPVPPEPIHHGFWLAILIWFVIFLGLMLTIWVDVVMGLFHRS